MHDSIWLGFLAADAIDLGEPPPLPHQLAPFEPVEPPAEGPDLTLPPPPEGGPAPAPSPQPPGPVTPPAGDIPDALWLAIQTYFRPEDWDCAVCISRYESSGFQPYAHRYVAPGTPSEPSGEDSWGYWQINIMAHHGITPDMCADPDWSTRYAAGLRYGRGDWGDWAWTALHVCGCPQNIL